MLVRSSFATLLTLCGAAVLAGPANAADPAPRDRTRPVITALKATPTLLCRDYYAGSIPTRQVSFTLSEDARVRLIKQPMIYGLFPLAPQGVTIPLAAGSHTLRSAATQWDVTEPGIFPFETEMTFDGYYALEAKDAAGNKSAVKWSRFLRFGDIATSRGAGTNGC